MPLNLSCQKIYRKYYRSGLKTTHSCFQNDKDVNICLSQLKKESHQWYPKQSPLQVINQIAHKYLHVTDFIDVRGYFVWTRYAVELSLLLTEQLVPALCRHLDHLRHAKRQRSHEVIPRRAIPVPDFNGETLRVVAFSYWTVGKAERQRSIVRTVAEAF